MPFVDRLVQPTALSRRPEAGAPAMGELSDANNLTLCSLLRQLSSLCGHANEIFGGLVSEMSAVAQRAADVDGRVRLLRQRAQMLNSDIETLVVAPGGERFELPQPSQVGLLQPDTKPQAVAELLAACEAPPELQSFDHLRSDGTNGRKLYSDPDFFFNLWAEQMLQEAQRSRRPQGARRPKPPQFTPWSPTRAEPPKPGVQQQQQVRQYVDDQIIYAESRETLPDEEPQQAPEAAEPSDSIGLLPAPPAPPAPLAVSANQPPPPAALPPPLTESVPPPPPMSGPPPPPASGPPPPPASGPPPPPASGPPPPPASGPPPPPASGPPPPPGSGAPTSPSFGGGPSSKPSASSEQLPAAPGNLLDQIRAGIKLKKVAKPTENTGYNTICHRAKQRTGDVQAIFDAINQIRLDVASDSEDSGSDGSNSWRSEDEN